MRSFLDLIAAPVRSEDGVVMMRRLLGALRITPGALFVPRSDAADMVETALEHGRRIGVAQTCGVQHCRVCGCTDITACDPPCSFVEGDLCSACAPFLEAVI